MRAVASRESNASSEAEDLPDGGNPVPGAAERRDDPEGTDAPPVVDPHLQRGHPSRRHQALLLPESQRRRSHVERLRELGDRHRVVGFGRRRALGLGLDGPQRLPRLQELLAFAGETHVHGTDLGGGVLDGHRPEPGEHGTGLHGTDRRGEPAIRAEGMHVQR